MVKENKNICRFPEEIGIEYVIWYAKNSDRISRNKNIIFDLSNTETIHSSFIGFLISTKDNIMKNGGLFNLYISKYVEKIFMQLDIYDYFSPVITIIHTRKSA